MDGRIPEVGDYVEVLINGKSKSGGNIRAKTPKEDIHISGGEEGDIVVVKIVSRTGYFEAEIVDAPSDVEIHSLVEYQRDLEDLDEDPPTSDRKEKYVSFKKARDTDDTAIKKWRKRDVEDEDQQDSEQENETDDESPFKDDIVGDKNDLI